MKKKLISALLMAGMLLSCAACGNQNTDNVEPTPEPGLVEADERTIDVYLDSYECGLLRVMEDGEEQEYGSIGLLAAQGDTIGGLLNHSGFSELTPVSDEDEFEGWMEYKLIITTDEDGFETFTYELVSEELYTTEQLLERTVADYAVDYVAKWASIPVEDYFNETADAWDVITTSGSFSFSANGGTMSFHEYDDREYDNPTYTYWLESGQALNDVMGTESAAALIDVTKDGAEFTGWTLYEADSAWWNNEIVEEDDITSYLYDEQYEDTRYLLLANAEIIRENSPTEELCGMSVEDGKSYFALANWN